MMILDFAQALGRALKVKRAELGIGQDALAHNAEMARSFISAIERGTTNPSLQSIIKLAETLECKPSELLSIAESLLENNSKST